MPTVTFHDEPETPSQQIISAAAAQAVTASATDPRGRRIAFRSLGALERMRFFEAIGAENSRNPQYLGVASIAAGVRSIDGEPVARPANKLQLEALVDRLGDDGIDAVAMELEAQAKKALAEAEAKTQAEADDLLKNASGTPNS